MVRLVFALVLSLLITSAFVYAQPQELLSFENASSPNAYDSGNELKLSYDGLVEFAGSGNKDTPGPFIVDHDLGAVYEFDTFRIHGDDKDNWQCLDYSVEVSLDNIEFEKAVDSAPCRAYAWFENDLTGFKGQHVRITINGISPGMDGLSGGTEWHELSLTGTRADGVLRMPVVATWECSTCEEQGVDGFRIFYDKVSHIDVTEPVSTASAKPYAVVVHHDDMSNFEHTFELPEGKYFFRMIAFKGLSESVFSNEAMVEITTSLDITAPVFVDITEVQAPKPSPE